MITTDLVIILGLILSAFFSGMEIAFVSSNRIFLEIEKLQDGISALGDGDLTVKMELNTTDEIGEISKTLDKTYTISVS